MSTRYSRPKWYQQKRWIIGSLLLFPPLGVPLLWLTHWPRAGKIGGSILSGLLLLSALAGESNEPKTVSAERPVVAAAEAPPQTAAIATTAYEEAISAATAATEKLADAESSTDWERISDQWQRALSSLGDIPTDSSDYSQAQLKIAQYQRNYDYAIAQREVAESAAAAAIAQEQQREAEIAQRQAAAIALSVVEVEGSYVSGTCKELRASGVGSDFTPGDANYTQSRDRDNDGIACES